MEIRTGSLIRDAEEAEGTVVVIDVYRAFTTAGIAFSRGAEKIIMVAKVEEAIELRNRGLADLCMGEVGGVRPKGFDHGNSPHELSLADVAGKTIAQSTRAGAAGVTSARKADKVYAGSLVVAGATVSAILKDSPDVLTLVGMGHEGREKTDEDEQCALYMRNLLQGRMPDHHAVRKLVLVGAESQKYDNPALPQFDPRDVEMALQIDSLPFAIRVSREDELMVARPEYV